MIRDQQQQSTNPNDIYHLTTQCLLIASHYFKSLRDYICLTRVSKRTREIMDILPYNPISINQITSLLFPNIRTLHLYNETDQIIKSPKIKQYVYWPLKTLYEAEEIRNKEKGIEIHFKKIVYTTRDFKEQQQKLEKEKPILEFIKIKPFVTIPNGIREIQPSCFANIKGIKSITVPESVTLIGKGCFDNCSDLREINLPSTIKYLYQNTFEKCPELTKITIPLNQSRIVIGNKIFNNQPRFNQALFLPSKIQIINGNEVGKLTSITIPSFVTYIDQKCFDDCYKLKELILPESLINIPIEMFSKMNELEKLTISTQFQICGNKIFGMNDGLLESIKLPKSIQQINGIYVENPISYTIPSYIKAINSLCFINCCDLKTVIFPSLLTSFDQTVFRSLQKLEELTISTSYKFYSDRLIRIRNKILFSLQLPSTIKQINGKKVKWKELTSYSIPSNIMKIDDYCFANCTKLTSLQHIEEIKHFGIGCFHRCEQFKKDDYPNVLQNDKAYIETFLSKTIQQQFFEWTGLLCGDILFNSDIDHWSEQTSVLNERINNRDRLLFYVEDDNGEKCGLYMHNKVIDDEDDDESNILDQRSFHFILSSIKRKQTLTKYHIHRTSSKVILYPQSSKLLIQIGDIQLGKQTHESLSTRYQLNQSNQLVNQITFTVTRLVVIQMRNKKLISLSDGYEWLQHQ